MSWPTDPKTLQVIDRVVVVLGAIIGGGPDYFYTAGEVVKGFKFHKTATKFPCYMVAAEGEPEKPRPIGDNHYLATLAVSVKAWVDLEAGEPVSKLMRCLRDVQRAINEDTKSGAGAGSLGVICTGGCTIDTAELDSGFLAIEGRGYGYFDLRVLATVEGDWGEI
jgi:hypothetical protein